MNENEKRETKFISLSYNYYSKDFENMFQGLGIKTAYETKLTL